MKPEEARRIVEEGLQRRKLQMLEKEQQLDWYEAEMISRCNQHCAEQRKERREAEIRNLFSMGEREARQAQELLEQKIIHAVKLFLVFSIITMMLTTWSPLEWWAALSLIAGAASFPAAYIFRLYYPIEEV